MSILNTIMYVFILTGCVMFMVSVISLYIHAHCTTRKMNKIKAEIDKFKHH